MRLMEKDVGCCGRGGRHKGLLSFHESPWGRGNHTVDLSAYRCRCRRPCLCSRACLLEMMEQRLVSPAGHVLSLVWFVFFTSFSGHPGHKLTANCWQLGCFKCLLLFLVPVEVHSSC